MRVIALVARFLVCAASAAKTHYETQSVQAAEGVEDGDLYSAAVAVMSDRGKTMRTQDREAGQLVTEWEDGGDAIGRSEYAWRISILDGEVRVNIDCRSELKEPEGTRWITCGDVRPESWTAEVPGLIDDIQSASSRYARKRAKKSKKAAPVVDATEKPAAEEPHDL